MMLALRVCLLSPVAAAPSSTVSILAPDAISGTGQQFTATIAVAPQMALSGMQCSLTFDPSLVSVDGVSEGNLLSQNGSATYFNPGTVDNQTGTITGVAGVIISPGQSVSSSGTFAFIRLRALSGGTCPLSLSAVIVGDPQGQPLPVSMVNDEVTIDANHRPVLAPIGNRSVSPGSLLTFPISATDADGDSLSFLAANLPGGASFDPGTRTFSWSPAASGTYSGIHFEVTDGQLSDAEDITVTVNTAPPVVGGGGGGGGGLLPIQYTNPNGSIVSGAISMHGEVLGMIKTVSSDSRATLTIPSGTYARGRTGAPLDHLSITIPEVPPAPPAGSQIMGPGYDFGPDGATFDPSVELSLSYDPATIPAGISEADLVFACYDEEAGNWTLPPFTLDVENSLITAEIAHFTGFFILADAPLPEFSFSNLSISPQEAGTNEEVNISLLVTNSGSAGGSCPVRLVIAGEVVTSHFVSIAAGDTEEVSFTVTRESAGTYSVDLNGLSGSFTVKQPPLPPPPAPGITAFSITPGYTETDRITSVNIAYALHDLPPSPASVTLTLKVGRDGEPLENFELLSGEALESGRIEGSREYAPDPTWQQGSYSFRVELQVDGQTVAISPTESLELTEEMLMPVIAWDILAKIIGAALALLTITVAVLLLVRRRFA